MKKVRFAFEDPDKPGAEFQPELARAGVAGVVLKVAYALIGLLVTLLLARSLGPEGYGTYAFVLALTTLVTLPAQSGLPNLVVRETAKAQATSSWDLLAGLWRWSLWVSIGLAVTLALCALAAMLLLRESLGSELSLTLFLGLLLVPIVAIGNVRSAALRGLRYIVLGQLGEFLVRPAILLAIIAVLAIWCPALLTPPTAMAAYVLAASIAALNASRMLNRRVPRAVLETSSLRYEPKAWVASAIPLALIAGMQAINSRADAVMLGMLRTPADVGIYNVATQAAALVVFGLQAVNMAASPHIARLHAIGDLNGLQRIATLSARRSLAIALPSAFVLSVAGSTILAFMFGDEFRRGANALTVLAAGQLVNALFGSVGMLLNMTGHERDTALGVALAALANVALNAILIPLMGMLGAAVATAITLTVWNVLLWVAVRRRLGINSMAFGRRL